MQPPRYILAPYLATPPEIALHVVQWQNETRLNGSVTSKVTPPQRQLPRLDASKPTPPLYPCGFLPMPVGKASGRLVEVR